MSPNFTSRRFGRRHGMMYTTYIWLSTRGKSVTQVICRIPHTSFSHRNVHRNRSDLAAAIAALLGHVVSYEGLVYQPWLPAEWMCS